MDSRLLDAVHRCSVIQSTVGELCLVEIIREAIDCSAVEGVMHLGVLISHGFARRTANGHVDISRCIAVTPGQATRPAAWRGWRALWGNGLSRST